MIAELKPDEIEELLKRETTGRIGCHAEGRTYVVPVTYVYEAGSVYGHSAEGMKVRMMRMNPSVCFEVDRIEDSANWRSVIAWGVFEELRGEAALRAMDLWIQRFAGVIMSETGHPSLLVREHGLPTKEDGKSVVLFRIRLTEKTGRFEKLRAGAKQW